MSRGRRAEIALVGMACWFPGAPDLYAFWSNVLANRDMSAVDPVERSPYLLLDVVSAALADAGIDPAELNPGRVEIVISKPSDFNANAASASSLAALQLGSRALRAGRADLALVGGTDVEADVDFPIGINRLGVVPGTGAARSFSTAANGLGPGEGVCVVVLKRLVEAERDRNRIYAVLKGVGLVRSRRPIGLVSFSTNGHARAIRRAYRSATVDPASVGLVERHRLGVPAADQAELCALRSMFPPPRSGSRILGAISTRIGGAMPAAGMTGLVTSALALHHRLFPPTHPVEPWESEEADEGFEHLAAPRPWIHGDSRHPRRAGVNAFDLARINAHAVLEEHAASADGVTPGALLDWDTETFLLAASDRRELADRISGLCEQLQTGPVHALKDLAFTLNTEASRSAGRVRLGLVAASQSELITHLAAVEPRLRDPGCRQIRDARGIYFWAQPLGPRGKLAFLFPGEGSQYHGMLADLCPHFPELRAVLDTADRIALESGEDVPPSRHLFGASASGHGALWATDTAVTAVLSSQWAIFQILSRLGLVPDAVAGHSSGELPALAAAGALRTEHVLERQLSRLAAIFRALDSQGTIPQARLVAAGTDRARAEGACRAAGPSAIVAVDNCPHQVVIAGPPEEVERAAANLRANGVVCERLPFARAYHTPAFAAVLSPLQSFYDSLELESPRIPIYSCSTGSRMPDSIDDIRRLAVAQWTRRVEFRETIETMYRDGMRIFVDVGARGNLCGYVEDTLRGRPSFAVASNLPRRSGTAQLNHLVASLFAQGLQLDCTYLYARRRPQRIDLRSGKPSKGLPRLEVDLPARRRSDNLIDLLGKQAGGNGKFPSNGYHSLFKEPGSNGNGDLSLTSTRRSDHDESMSDQVQDIERCPDDRDRVMLGFLTSMKDFLSTQRQVMHAYLARSLESSFEVVADEPKPGPWIGTIHEWAPGRRLVSHLPLDKDDPVAAIHTLGGRRVSALERSRKGLPVVPFSVMAEIIAQAGALLVPAGLHLDSLRDVRAHRWVPYGPGSMLIIRAESDEADPLLVHVTLYHSQLKNVPESDPSRLVYEGSARFCERMPEPIVASAFHLPHPRASRFTAQALYREQWLFHGPPMQALTQVGTVSQEGITGTVTLRPLAGLLRPGEPATFLTDPIAVDTFTHLLGCWGLDCLDQGDVIFPLGMGCMTIHGPSPQVGTEVECRIKIREIEHHRVRVDAELVCPDGLVWVAIRDWEDWRFYWPARYRDVFRSPDTILISEELPLSGMAPSEAIAVWLAPPADMARPIWRDVLEQTQLGPEELGVHLSEADSQVHRTQCLWGRIAVKEAARRLWLASGGPPRYPADLAIIRQTGAAPRVQDLARPECSEMPSISVAHTAGIVIALAARESRSLVGIDIEPITECSEGTGIRSFQSGMLQDTRPGEPESSGEWIARRRAARQAAARAGGLGPEADLLSCKIASCDVHTGEMLVELHPARQQVQSAPAGRLIAVRTERRGNHVWAWTLGEKAVL